MGEEVGSAAADVVVCGWGVDHFLHVGAVEVVVGAGAEGGESELVPEIGAVICQVVDVEAWVHVVGSIVDVVVQIATLGDFWSRGNRARWGKLRGPFVVEWYETAGFAKRIHLSHVRLVEPNNI